MDINIDMKVEGNQVIFTLENADPESVNNFAQFLATGVDILQGMPDADAS